MPTLQEFRPKPRRLFASGPGELPPRVTAALSTPILSHLDPQFHGMLAEVADLLRALLGTRNELTLVAPGAGMAGMECCFANLLEPGDQAVVCVSGAFGLRMVDVAERTGTEVIRADAEWGRAVEPRAVEEALGRAPRAKLVAVVQGETSTGVLQPLEEIGRLARAAGAIYLVDAVTTIGGVEIRMDEWGIDALYGGSQKCLSAPPGLAPVSFGPRAVAVLEARKSRVQSWYLDLTLLRKYWGPERVYHHTPAEPLYCALREALRLVDEEGLEKRYARQRRNQDRLADGLESLGFEIVAPPANRLPMLTVARPPAGREAPAIQRSLLDEHAIEVAGGLGPWAGRVLRFGLMGWTSTVENVDLLLGALRGILSR